MRGNVTVEISDAHSSSSESRWQDFWSWKTPHQLCVICLVPFVLIFIGCVLLGLYWSGKFPPSSNQAVLTSGMVSFFSGFLMCVIANFCDACGVTCSRHGDIPNNEEQNNTMFVDLSELGPNPNDLEYNDDKLNSQTIHTDENTPVENHTNVSDQRTPLTS